MPSSEYMKAYRAQQTIEKATGIDIDLADTIEKCSQIVLDPNTSRELRLEAARVLLSYKKLAEKAERIEKQIG